MLVKLFLGRGNLIKDGILISVVLLLWGITLMLPQSKREMSIFFYIRMKRQEQEKVCEAIDIISSSGYT